MSGQSFICGGEIHRESPLPSPVKVSKTQKGLERADSCHMFTCLTVRERDREKEAASVVPLPDDNADLCLHPP